MGGARLRFVAFSLFLPPFGVLLGDEGAHRGGGIGLLLNAHLGAGATLPQGRHLPTHGFAACVGAASITDVAGGIRRGDVQVGRCRDGILVRAEEEELPLVGVRLLQDLAGDVLPCEFLGRVLVSVGENGDDDLSGAVRLRDSGQPVTGALEYDGSGKRKLPGNFRARLWRTEGEAPV